jgi:hypothetical protein
LRTDRQHPGWTRLMRMAIYLQDWLSLEFG